MNEPMNRDKLDNLKAQQIAQGQPARSTEGRTGDPQRMLRNFHYNHPFVGVMQAPKATQSVFFDDTTDVTLDVPDNAIAVSFTFAGFVIVSLSSRQPSALGAITKNVPRDDVIVNPTPAMLYWTYGIKQIVVRGTTGSAISVNYFVQDVGTLGE